MQRIYDRCPNCMQALSSQDKVCPYCDYDIAGYDEKPTCLRPFTVLQNKYMLGRVIGVGGFGITYIGWDLNLQTYIAIKEYFPESLAGRDTQSDNAGNEVIPHEAEREVYDKGLRRYVEEARNLSKFYQLQGIVSVKDFFYENGTGYIVMEYINGINLKEYLKNSGGRLDEGTVLSLMKPVLESLYQIHRSGLVHRDISPDNIMVTGEGNIKLIDFGSARGNSSQSEKTYTVILKHGYAPPEQYYSKGNQGPWTDIYSLCATMYKMLTGEVPQNSVERMENDEYVPPSFYGTQTSPRTEAVLAKGLAVRVTDRYQNIGELLLDLYGTNPVEYIGEGTPNPGGSYYGASVSSSQQSMHFSMQPDKTLTDDDTDNNKKNNRIAVIVVAAAVSAIVAIIIAMILSSNGSKNQEAEYTEAATTTEETTEATDTEDVMTDEAVTEGEDYLWPTELSDNWEDYTIQINGTIYQFPIPYTEFVAKGWSSTDIPDSVVSGDFAYANYTDDTIMLKAIIANYGLNEAEVEDCYVIGVDFDSAYNDYSDDASILMSGGVELFVSDETAIKQAFGAPDYKSDYEAYSSLTYYDEDAQDGMDITIRDGVFSGITLINASTPYGFDIDISDIETTPPSINSQYEAPASQSSDRLDGIVTIEGVNYQLPVPVSELMANGWTLDSSATDDYISGNNCCYTELQKDGSKISICLNNYTNNSILPANAFVSEISADSDYCSIDIVFPGGIALGSPGSDYDNLYADMEDYDRSDYSSFISRYVYYYDDSVYISISAYSDTETDVINEYTYTRETYEY